MTDSPTSQAMHLAMTELEHRRERIAELEEALRKCLTQLEQLAPVNGRVHDEREAIAAARSVLNKETNRA